MAEADDPGFSDSIVIELDLQEGGESSTGSVVGYGGEARKFGDHRSATSEVPLSPEPLSGITTYAPTELTRGGGRRGRSEAEPDRGMGRVRERKPKEWLGRLSSFQRFRAPASRGSARRGSSGLIWVHRKDRRGDRDADPLEQSHHPARALVLRARLLWLGPRRGGAQPKALVAAWVGERARQGCLGRWRPTAPFRPLQFRETSSSLSPPRRRASRSSSLISWPSSSKSRSKRAVTSGVSSRRSFSAVGPMRV